MGANRNRNSKRNKKEEALLTFEEYRYLDELLKKSKFFNSGDTFEINPYIHRDGKIIKLSQDELIVLKYIFNNGYVTNQLSRDELGYGKTKSAQMFKNLVELEQIIKQGAGCNTCYILK